MPNWPLSDEAKSRVWGVGALTRAVADALHSRFGLVTVRGELSGWMQASSGHCYFNLKDAQGQLRCALFKRAAQSSRVQGRDGLQVEVQGRLEVYAPRGDLQLIVESMTPVGQGNLYEQFLQLKATLEAQGYFDSARKRPVPAFPRGIAVVTSLQAAALRDVATTLQRRVPHLPVSLFPTPVQGDEAPPQIVKALRSAYRHWEQHRAFDVLLLVRGGGALEDLWAFNQPEVVMAVADAPVPVVSGVGHETDVTLVDFVADVRAATPTAAAEVCAPSRLSLLDDLDTHARHLRRLVDQSLRQHAQRLDRLQLRMGQPRWRIHRAQQRFEQLAQRLSQAPQQRLGVLQQRHAQLQHTLAATVALQTSRHQAHLDRLGAHLRGLDPALVLQRGYAWVTDAYGHALTSVTQTQPGQAVRAQLHDGHLEMTIDASQPRKPA